MEAKRERVRRQTEDEGAVGFLKTGKVEEVGR